MRTTRLLTVLPAVFLSGGLCAQNPSLVKDLNTNPHVDHGSYPGEMVLLQNGDVLFAASEDSGLRTLYRLALGTGKPQLIKEVRWPGYITSIGRYALFGANYGEFWGSDGTAAGTRMLLKSSRYAMKTTRVQNQGYVWGDDGLYVSNGTPSGTRLFFKLPAAMTAYPMTAVGSELFFDATVSGSHQLWKIHATTAIASWVANVRALAMFALGTRLIFSAWDSTNGISYWVSDGTAKGTVLLRDIDGPKSIPVPYPEKRFTQMGGRAFFSARQPNGSYGLWATNGTPAGTTKIKDVPGEANELTSVGANVFLMCKKSLPNELWRSDGTAIGTFRLQTLMNDAKLFAGRTAVFFDCAPPMSGDLEPWRSDGTIAGTFMLKDINPGMGSSFPGDFTWTSTSQILFRADDGIRGHELWITDGTLAGTRILADIATSAVTEGNRFRASAHDAGLELFELDKHDWSNHTRIFATDSTSVGTNGLGLDGTLFRPVPPARLGRDLILAGEKPGIGMELFKSDGTLAGTKLIRNIQPDLKYLASSFPKNFTRMGGYVYFSAFHSNLGRELWRTDGSWANLVVDIIPGSAITDGPDNLVVWRNRLYFVKSESSTKGGQIYSTDGTAKGTTMLDRSKSNTPWYFPSGLEVVGNNLFFWASALSTQLGSEPWKTDGTVAGTSMLKDIHPGPQGSQWGQFLRVLNDVLYFSARSPSAGGELWRTDGTAKGTYMVKDIRPGTGDSLIGVPAALGDLLFFLADDGKSGIELWKSDGTSGGTALVKDINPGEQDVISSYVLYSFKMQAAGKWLYFPANDGKVGTELWRTDGSAAGTTLVVDLRNGVIGSVPSYLQLCRGELLFAADDGILGAELWKLSVGATSQAAGGGCSLGREPVLAASPPTLGSTMNLGIKNGFGAAGMLLFGTGHSTPNHIGNGCHLYVDPGKPHLVVLFTPSKTGAWSMQVKVPNHPALHGLLIPAQAGVGPTATGPIGTDLTNGVYLAPRR